MRAKRHYADRNIIILWLALIMPVVIAAITYYYFPKPFDRFFGYRQGFSTYSFGTLVAVIAFLFVVRVRKLFKYRFRALWQDIKFIMK